MVQRFRRHRYPTAFPVTVITAHGPRTATMIDVNESGARLKGVSDVERNETVVIRANNQSAKAIVRWISQTCIGVTFRPMIDLRTLDLLRQAPRSSLISRRFNSAVLTEMR